LSARTAQIFIEPNNPSGYHFKIPVRRNVNGNFMESRGRRLGLKCENVSIRQMIGSAGTRQVAT
jgi:hypothetical protein